MRVAVEDRTLAKHARVALGFEGGFHRDFQRGALGGGRGRGREIFYAVAVGFEIVELHWGTAAEAERPKGIGGVGAVGVEDE